jgi:hypothetical protein
MMCGPPKPSHPAETYANPRPSRPKVAKLSRQKAQLFYVSRSRFLMIWRPKTVTPRPHLIVPGHGCAFELQNHREYGVTSCRAKGVCEKI